MFAQPAEGTTGTATILVTDLVDLTGQRARLGEETAEALLASHDRQMLASAGPEDSLRKALAHARQVLRL